MARAPQGADDGAMNTITEQEISDLLLVAREIEGLLLNPGIKAHRDKAKVLAMSIARSAPHAGIASLAMRLIGTMDSRGLERREYEYIGQLQQEVSRLRVALQETQKLRR